MVPMLNRPVGESAHSPTATFVVDSAIIAVQIALFGRCGSRAGCRGESGYLQLLPGNR